MLEKAEQIVGEIKENENFDLKDTGELSELTTAVKISMDSLRKHIEPLAKVSTNKKL